MQWHNAYLEIHGLLRKKSNNAESAANTKVSLIHNTIPHVSNRAIQLWYIRQGSHLSSDRLQIDIQGPKGKKVSSLTIILISK